LWLGLASVAGVSVRVVACTNGSKEEFPLVCLYVCIYIYIYIYMFYICDVLIVTSPYLLVFGDDRVRGTQEQMML